MKIFVSNTLGNSSFFARFSKDMLALASPTLTRALLKPTPTTINRADKKIMFSPAKIIKRIVPGGSPRRKETRILSQTQDTPTGTAEKKKKSSSSSKTVDEKEMSVKDAKEIFQSTLHSKMTVETAELIAKNFESMGIRTPRELRKIVVKQNIKLILFEAMSILFNLGVTVAIYSIFLLNDAPVAWEPGKSELVSQVIAFALFICAGIFSVETVAHTVVFFSFVYSLFFFSFANLDKFTKAMHTLAEDAAGQPDLSSIRSIRRAVSATRVLQKLNEVKKAIIEDKKLADESLKDMPELKRLSAYFELKNAIDEHGFSYAQYGLTEERAMVLASLFADVDEDADGEINEEELRKLLTEMAKNEHVEWTSLNADFNVAFNLLDTDGDGKIDLDNFCEWLSEPEKTKKEESKVSPR
jgi:Ca2+-binding EF-hand superfamily protein